jgi:hypothetical protein
MPALTFKDMKLSIGVFGGNVRVQLRTLDKTVTEQELAALIYPVFDAQEKALPQPDAKSEPDATSGS